MAKKCGNCGKCRKAQEAEHKEKKCDKECHTECDAKVDLKVDLEPHVRHTQSAKRHSSFQVALDFKTEPRCCIKPLCVKRTGKCKHKAIFAIDVDLDLECRSQVSRPCSQHATFDLDVAVDAETHAKSHNTCHREASEHSESEF